MRIVFSITAAILVLGLCHTAVAYSPPQRLTPTNLTSYPFVSIKAQDGPEGCKQFVVTVTPRQEAEPGISLETSPSTATADWHAMCGLRPQVGATIQRSS